MKQHTVKRAIIMAAGLGTRLRPITNVLPKPFIEVNGVRMIDSIIDGLRQNGVHEIHVVLGYKPEFAALLTQKYPDLDLIFNPDFDRYNNISSLYCAREFLDDVIILDGDQIVYNPKILHPEFDHSGYCCTYTDQATTEWILDLDSQRRVVKTHADGATKGWQLHSVSRWAKEDGARLRRWLEYEYNELQHRDIYWDNVALLCHPEDFELGIYPIQPEDIIEIDSYDELVALDSSYKLPR